MPALHLLRHGIADGAGADPPLSAEGARLMEAQAIGLTRLGFAADVVLTSPLRRAQDTARIVAQVLGAAPPAVSSLLGPGCCLELLDDLFLAHRGAGALLLVGHQPDLGRMAATLTGAREPLALERGALCSLEVAGWPPRAPATLRQILTPDFLRSRAAL